MPTLPGGVGGQPPGVRPQLFQRLLPPWETIRYFQQPIENIVVLVGAAAPVEVVKADPMRIALIFYNTAGANVAFVTSKSSSAVGQGIQVNSGNPLYLPQSVYGSLVQSQLFASCSPANVNLGVIEVRLASWPEGA